MQSLVVFVCNQGEGMVLCLWLRHWVGDCGRKLEEVRVGESTGNSLLSRKSVS